MHISKNNVSAGVKVLFVSNLKKYFCHAINSHSFKNKVVQILQLRDRMIKYIDIQLLYYRLPENKDEKTIQSSL